MTPSPSSACSPIGSSPALPTCTARPPNPHPPTAVRLSNWTGGQNPQEAGWLKEGGAGSVEGEATGQRAAKASIGMSQPGDMLTCSRRFFHCSSEKESNKKIFIPSGSRSERKSIFLQI